MSRRIAALAALTWAVIAYVALAGGEPCPGGRTPNHSGVIECHTGPYTGPLPTDTTTGDITL